MRAIVNAQVETITQGRIAGGAVVLTRRHQGRRKDVSIPEGTEIIDAQGKAVTQAS